MRLTLNDIRYLKDNGYTGSYLDAENDLRKMPDGGETGIPNYSPDDLYTDVPVSSSSTYVDPSQQQLQYQQFETSQDLQNLTENEFEDKWRTGKHRYQYDTNPAYREKAHADAESIRHVTGSVDYPSTDYRSASYQGNPNLAFMRPNQDYNADAIKNVEQFNMNVIEAAIPYGLMLKASKAPRYLNKAGRYFNELGETVSKKLSTASRNPQRSLVQELREELAEKGILQSQRTPNYPWKEPIRKGIEPWSYEFNSMRQGMEDGTLTGSKIKDFKGAIFGGKNPLYSTEEQWKKARQYQSTISPRPEISKIKSLKEAINFRDKSRLSNIEMVGDNPLYPNITANRYATWDMYLGKPQTKFPLYDVSELTESADDVVYTIKEGFMQKDAVDSKIRSLIYQVENPKEMSELSQRVSKGFQEGMLKKTDNNKWRAFDRDNNYFGTMGGFNWEVSKLGGNEYRVLANDVWDLHPLKDKALLEGLPKKIKNLEAGKTLGIGKPLNVKVGFIYNSETKEVTKRFGVVPAALAGTELLKNKDNGNEEAK